MYLSISSIKIIIASFVVGLLATMAGIQPASAQPGQETSSVGWQPGVIMTRVCTYTVKPGSSEAEILPSSKLFGRPDNRLNPDAMGYEQLSDVDQTYGVLDTQEVKALALGKRQLLASFSPKSDYAPVDVTITAADTPFASMSFGSLVMCPEYYAAPSQGERLRFTYTTTCVMQVPTNGIDTCTELTAKVKVTNLAKKAAKLRLVRGYENEDGAVLGNAKSFKLKAKQSRTYRLYEAYAEQGWCYDGGSATMCRDSADEDLTFGFYGRGGRDLSGVWQHMLVPAWGDLRPVDGI